jgi:hypothetical protein
MEVVLLFEAADVLADHLRGLAQGAVLLLVGGGEPDDVALFEDRRERPHALELVADRVQVLLLQNPRERRGLVAVVGEDVPAAEDQVAHPRERHEVLYLCDAVLGALAQADGPELRQRPDRLGEALFHQLDAGDKRRRHRSHALQEHPQLAVGLPYLPCFAHPLPLFAAR